MNVLRISPLAESARIHELLDEALGTTATVESVYPDPALVEAALGTGRFDLVLLQSVPPESRDRIEAACADLPVLRPVYTELRSSRGERVHRIERLTAA